MGQVNVKLIKMAIGVAGVAALTGMTGKFAELQSAAAPQGTAAESGSSLRRALPPTSAGGGAAAPQSAVPGSDRLDDRALNEAARQWLERSHTEEEDEWEEHEDEEHANRYTWVIPAPEAGSTALAPSQPAPGFSSSSGIPSTSRPRVRSRRS